jgi:carboxylesterase type B
MSEDCLYLNIFTPLSNGSLSLSLLPVMIFIHDGHFQFGDASQSVYEAEHLVNTTNVIVALIQYRLGKYRLSSLSVREHNNKKAGVFGFLATGNGPNDIKGNYGILDQRLAIAWIKTNIDAFGGDPNEVCTDRH